MSIINNPAALTGLRHHRREPGQDAGADVLQAAHQRACRPGKEREGFHRAAGRQWKQHAGAKENSAAGTNNVQTVMMPIRPGSTS
ncbi:hypothetical protein DMH27_14420 [Raoultella planticola]|nr:hypothetical protein [Raoultella planticola]